jgi:hypothetical protein
MREVGDLIPAFAPTEAPADKVVGGSFSNVHAMPELAVVSPNAWVTGYCTRKQPRVLTPGGRYRILGFSTPFLEGNHGLSSGKAAG